MCLFKLFNQVILPAKMPNICFFKLLGCNNQIVFLVNWISLVFGLLLGQFKG